MFSTISKIGLNTISQRCFACSKKPLAKVDSNSSLHIDTAHSSETKKGPRSRGSPTLVYVQAHHINYDIV